ncbi:biogenesis of lysosome-related organelles complex 1 subunit 5 isoform X1 [Venturia canescens]|uniref:biogenesis of lysosome-related organelles complex 1 subunit 5 isoform X1 n=1 Tax=Venturia canescens TaxID=32260 RepID=UPI001C9D198E|nr:biogenesis of lysosome-related organelles complex 1 subunit 5 isoform X1 [Venturia canescens]
MATVIKDIGEIWSRLFDHRPFVHGEITYFLRELEKNRVFNKSNEKFEFPKERRGDREVERLFKILEYSTELSQSQLDRAEQLGDCHLPSLKANADVALSMCERILDREEQFYNDTKIQENRERRKVEWQCFINDMSDKCEKVDRTFQEKEEELKEFYIDLEKKLHIGA